GRIAAEWGSGGRNRSLNYLYPVFGWVKQAVDFRSFSVRGVAKVAGEWSIVCLALNLRRIAKMASAR
ncbi:MAG: hypothetical protein ACI85K_002761, partial [Hyphomicrobiaceae bacterium]